MQFHLIDILNERDELRARNLREEFGRRSWLVSWNQLEQGLWLARLSCPEVPVTVERKGRTRCEAVQRASGALTLILSSDDE